MRKAITLIHDDDGGKRYTADQAIRMLVELDRQIICPRPSTFGHLAHLVAAMALHIATTIHQTGDTDFLTFDDLGDISWLQDNASLPSDARATWRLGS